MSFEKLFWNRFDELNKDTNLAYTFGCDAYKAGAASRQAEIDELRFKLETAEKNLNNAFKTIKFEQQHQEELQAEVEGLQNDLIKAAEGQMRLFEHNNELQNRIDEVLRTIEPSDEITHSLYRKVYKILKGEK